MKLKNLFALVLALALALTMFVGCTPKDDEKNESNVSNESSETSSEDVTSEEPVPTATIEDVHTAVKELLGENYIPKMAFDEQILSEQVKLTPDMYEDVIAEGPMMSAHVDTFIAVEAAEGKVQDVENALKAYKETLAGGFQYPSNMSKVNAAQILTIDNKVFFVLLGAYPENQEMTEEDLAAYYADEVQKVVDVINTTLGK